MAIPSKSWVTITDAMTDADSPLDVTLMQGVRDNLVHLEEWLGDGYTAAKDHDHDGTNSAPVALAATTAAGSYLSLNNPTERTSTTNNVYEKKKETLSLIHI